MITGTLCGSVKTGIIFGWRGSGTNTFRRGGAAEKGNQGQTILEKRNIVETRWGEHG